MSEANCLAATRTDEPQAARTGNRLVPIVIVLLVLIIGGWVAQTLLSGGSPKNILIMGLDEDKIRTDVLLLAHIDPGSKRVSLISIPRDTLVEIPCEGLQACLSPDKVNHAHAYGGSQGPEVTVKAVEGLLDITIAGYLRADFEGFAKVIDALGGVALIIDRDMYYEDPYANPPLLINFKASDKAQHLDGQAALEFVRYRDDGRGDIGRTERTRQFLVALLREVQGSGVASKLPKMATTMLPYIKTDLDTGALVALARVAPSVDPGTIQTATIPGDPVVLPDGRWVWQANTEATRDLVDSLLHGK
jgi:LCP family protein required for cell wall assembly